MLQKGTPEQIARVNKAFLAMKQFDSAELDRAVRVDQHNAMHIAVPPAKPFC